MLVGFFILGLLAYRTYMAHPPVPAARGRCAGPRPLHRQRHLQGPAGLPAQRPHGVRVGVRPRRLPRPRLHGRLPAPLVRSRQALLRRQRVGLGRAQDDRGLPHQPLRQAHEDADAHRAAGRRPSARSCRTTAASSPTRRPSTACGPNAITDRTQLRQLTAFFAWTAWAASTEPPRPRLLLHQQLAARSRASTTSRRPT